MRKLLVGGMLTLAGVAGLAAPAFAHDCFNPNKHTGAGSKGTLTLDANGDEVGFQQTGKGNGGFFSIDATALGVGVIDVHTLGSGKNPHGVVGGPGSQKADHACDGKGIDYASACFGAEPGE
jgi:hypothetical protein